MDRSGIHSSKRKLSHDGKTEIKQNKGLDSAEDKASTKRQKDPLGASGSNGRKGCGMD